MDDQIQEKQPLLAKRSSIQKSPTGNTSHRQPFQHGSPGLNSDHKVTYNRFKYYSKLANNHLDIEEDRLLIPDHIIPSELFIVGHVDHDEEGHVKAGGKQNSLVTIFSIWNTMIGSSLLTMPWAIQQAGFGLGISLIILQGLITGYSCVLILRMGGIHDYVRNNIEWSDIIGKYLGRVAEHVNTVFSIITLLGGCVAYWILLSNFLFHVGDEINNLVHPDRIGGDVNFQKVWKINYVTVFIFPLLFAVSSMKSINFFAKFNSFGILSVFYMLFFSVLVLVRSPDASYGQEGSGSYEASFSFYKLTGVLMQSYFIHNSILAICRNNHDQTKNVRDCGIAYFLTCICYLIVGVCFWLAYEGNHSNIPSNLLDCFENDNYWAFGARIFLFFQIFTVFPLLAYIVRIQTIQLFGRAQIGTLGILLLNLVVCSLCLLFGLFYTDVGNILRFVGAFTGSVCMFALPCAVWIKHTHETGTGNKISYFSHGLLIVLAFANFAAQFIVS